MLRAKPGTLSMLGKRALAELSQCMASLSSSPSLFFSLLFLISVSFFSETGPQAHCVPRSASLVLGLPGSFLAGSPAAWRDPNR